MLNLAKQFTSKDVSLNELFMAVNLFGSLIGIVTSISALINMITLV